MATEVARFFYNPSVLLVAAIIINSVGIAGSISLVALASTNLALLTLAAGALRNEVNEAGLVGKKKWGVIATGITLLVALIALNVLGITKVVDANVVGGVHLSI